MEGEPGLGKETLDEGWPVLDTFEPVLDDRGELVHVGRGQVAQAVSPERAYGQARETYQLLGSVQPCSDTQDQQSDADVRSSECAREPQQCPELTGEVSDSVKSHRPRGGRICEENPRAGVRRRNWLGAWGLLWCCACRD